MNWTIRLIESQEQIDFLTVAVAAALEEQADLITEAHRAGMSLEQIAAVPEIDRAAVEAALTGGEITQAVQTRRQSR